MIETPALQISSLEVHYKDFKALWGVSLDVQEGEMVSIIGANGAGKSTLLNTVAGLFQPTSGTVCLFGERIDGMLPHETVPRGLSCVPERRRVFPRLTVYENLIIGAYTPKSRLKKNETIDKVYALFPILKNRYDQMADSLSGGEQQMLAIGRALMSNPKVLLCDEISLGLAPIVVKDIYKRLTQINHEGVAIVLVEQDVKRSLAFAHRVYIMQEGKIVLDGEPSSLDEEDVKRAYFGI